MKLIVCLLVFCSFLFGCNNELPSKQISNISVIRRVSSNNNISQTNNNTNTAATATTTVVATTQQSKTRYHIIVASFSTMEKAKAQSLVAKLKAKDYPAVILYSSQRYRVSIENFVSEAEAKIKRDEYRVDTDQKGIWVLQLN